MTSNQSGFEVSLGRTEPERIEARRERLRRQAEVLDLPVREREHWANRRFAATLDIRDSDHVARLRSVDVAMQREKFYRRGLAHVLRVNAAGYAIRVIAFCILNCGSMSKNNCPLFCDGCSACRSSARARTAWARLPKLA